MATTDHTAATPATYYALTDHLGTVHAFADSSGNIAESYAYVAWGNVLAVYDASGAPLAASALGNRYLFQGREYSFATRLYHFRARWYDPQTGRWLSNDPIGVSGGLNQYPFCGNDPVNYVDPSGLRYGIPSFGSVSLIGKVGIAGILLQGTASWCQLSVDIQGLFLSRDAISAELAANQKTMLMLRNIIESDGELDWPEGYGTAGKLGVKLAPQGGVCEERQKVRNLFESKRNLRGIKTGFIEGVTRAGTTGLLPVSLPKHMLPGRRLNLAKALLSRQQAYDEFLSLQWSYRW